MEFGDISNKFWLFHIQDFLNIGLFHGICNDVELNSRGKLSKLHKMLHQMTSQYFHENLWYTIHGFEPFCHMINGGTSSKNLLHTISNKTIELRHRQNWAHWDNVLRSACWSQILSFLLNTRSQCVFILFVFYSKTTLECKLIWIFSLSFIGQIWLTLIASKR